MNIKKVFGNAVGVLLLVSAGIAVIAGIGVVGLIVIEGATVNMVMLVMTAFGFSLFTGTFGYYTRKRVAGNVLSLDYDIAPGLRRGP